MQNDSRNQKETELTEREKEILRLLATGTSNKDIARQLSISSNTVKVHLRNIFAKISVASRTEAVMYAIRTGVVQTGITEIENKNESPIDSSQPVEVPSVNGGRRVLLGEWISHRWYVVLILILALGLATGNWINSRLHSVTPLMVTAIPSPTTPSRWQKLADMPTARYALAVAVYGNQIFAIGGNNQQGVTNAVESYDIQRDIWQKKPPTPLPVSDIEAGVIGGKIYIPGGHLASGKVTNSLEIYDPRQDRWELGAALPISFSSYAMVSFEGKLYIFGGWDGNQYLNTVLVYDPGRDTWSNMTHMPTKRGFAGAAVLDGKIYVIGGYNGSSALSINEVYSPERDQGTDIPWSTAANLPEGRYAMGVSNLTNLLYIVGGRGEIQAPLSPLFYNPQANSWDKIEAPPFSNHENSMGLVSFGNFLYVVGGVDAQEVNHSLVSYQAIFTTQFPIVR